MNGVVNEFDVDVGFGTIAADDGTIYRFHCAEIADGTRAIDVGAAVAFDVLPKLGAYEAACVRKR